MRDIDKLIQEGEKIVTQSQNLTLRSNDIKQLTEHKGSEVERLYDAFLVGVAVASKKEIKYDKI